MNQSVAISCRDSPINAYWNNATNPPDQTISNASSLPAFLAYAVFGAISSVLNTICILTFIIKKELREKYFLFAVLAFGNLINTVFMCQAGILRIYLIYNNRFNQLRSTFECLQFVGPHLQLLGGQLPAVVLLVIDIERLIAVYRPMIYKVHINYRARIFMVSGCFVAVTISQLFGYLSSYMNRDACVSSFCAVKSAYGLSYSNYNSAVIVLFPVIAFILNVFTYIGAKRLGHHANMEKELNMILVTLIITFVDVMLIACPNFVVFAGYNGLFSTPGATVLYMYVFFCCNSAINLFVYTCLKQDFRNQFFMLVSFGALKSSLNIPHEISNVHPTRKAVLSHASAAPVRSMSNNFFPE